MVFKEDQFFAPYENLNMQSSDIALFNEGMAMPVRSEAVPTNQDLWPVDGTQYGDGGTNWSAAVYGLSVRDGPEHQRFNQNS